jgi:hypothetical protein
MGRVRPLYIAVTAIAVMCAGNCHHKTPDTTIGSMPCMTLHYVLWTLYANTSGYPIALLGGKPGTSPGEVGGAIASTTSL